MKRIHPLTSWIPTACLILLSAFHPKPEGNSQHPPRGQSQDDPLKKEALEILDTKCNVCHRKQNPFMVFRAKNMEKRAQKIYRLVFIERRMPKGDNIRLSPEEYRKLENWLITQAIQ